MPVYFDEIIHFGIKILQIYDLIPVNCTKNVNICFFSTFLKKNKTFWLCFVK